MDGSLVLKLTDFGLSCEDPTSDVLCGTPEYMAPEIRGKAPYDRSVDIFALGVSLCLLLTGSLIEVMEILYHFSFPVLSFARPSSTNI
jgi:serine/threonine protein kinase